MDDVEVAYWVFKQEFFPGEWSWTATFAPEHAPDDAIPKTMWVPRELAERDDFNPYDFLAKRGFTA